MSLTSDVLTMKDRMIEANCNSANPLGVMKTKSIKASKLSAQRRGRDVVPGDANYTTHGKGDRPRFGDKQAFDDNYDVIDWASSKETER